MNWMAQRIENTGVLRVLYLLGPPRQAWQVTRNKQSQFHRSASSREDPPLGNSDLSNWVEQNMRLSN